MATDLQVTKTDGTATVVPGTLDTYTITVTNNGPDTVSSVTLADPLPAGTLNATFAPSVGAYDVGSGVWSGLSLTSGNSVSMTLGVTINPSATGSFSNTVTVAPPAGVTDTNPASNSATDTGTLTPMVDLQVTISDGKTSVVPGTSDTYTIVVTNNGPSTAVAAAVTDVFPAAITAAFWTAVASPGSSVAAATGTGNIATTVTLLPGGNATYTAVAQISPSATRVITNTATVSPPVGVTDTNPANNSATDTDAIPQSPIDNTQSSLALTQAFVTAGVFPPRDGPAGGAFLDEIFTFAFNFAPPGGTLGANGQLLSIAQNQAVFSLIGTTYGGNGTTNFALPNLGGATMIGTGQGPGLSPEQLGVPDGTSSVTLTLPELPPDLGGTSQSFSNYQPSLPVTYMICVQGTFPSQGGGGGGQDLIGKVMPFAGNFVPTDYLPADGRLLQINQNQALFSLLGTTYGGDGVTTFALPDLRGRTIIGASTTDPLGTLVGSPTVSLSNSQAPNGFGNTVQPFDNREPSLALNYLISLGIFPSLNGSNVVDPSTPFLGEVMAFAGNFAPSGWALANVNQNQALFSLLGTTYGGDGRVTFGLPDLRDRTVIGTGNGVTIGSQLGANFSTVTAAKLPPLPPALSVTSIASATKGQVINLSSLVTIADPGLVGYQQLHLWDTAGTVAGGQFVQPGDDRRSRPCRLPATAPVGHRRHGGGRPFRGQRRVRDRRL